MVWVGRQNCGSDPMNGPLENQPSADMHIHDLLQYFQQEFGFNAQQVTALLGAHSLGRVHEEFTGFIGPGGWDRGQEEMVGSGL